MDQRNEKNEKKKKQTKKQNLPPKIESWVLPHFHFLKKEQDKEINGS